MVKYTDQQNQCKILNFADLWNWVGNVWSTTTRMSQWCHCCRFLC